MVWHIINAIISVSKRGSCRKYIKLMSAVGISVECNYVITSQRWKIPRWYYETKNIFSPIKFGVVFDDDILFKT